MTTPTATHLTTGWEPDLPDADSLCLTWLRHWSDQLEAFARSVGGRTARDERFLLADYGRPASFFNSVVLLAPPPDRAGFDALLDEIESRTAAGPGALYLWSLWPTPDLRERGWELDGHPPLLVRPPGAVAAVPTGPPPTPVRSAAELAVWEQIVVRRLPDARAPAVPARHAARPGPAGGPPVPLLARSRRGRHAGDRDRASSWPAGSPGSPSVSPCPGIAAAVTGRGRSPSGCTRSRAAGMSACSSDHSRRGAERAGFLPVLRHTLWHRDR